MSDNNDNNVDMNADDLNQFEDLFFGRKTPEATVEEDDSEGVDSEEDDNPLATEDDDDDSDAEQDEAEDEEDEEEEEKPSPKPKKKSAQERINELTAKAREAERKAAEALRRAEAAEAAVEEKRAKTEPKALKEQLPADAPTPDALDDDGEPLYPLGEFDPKFIRDLTKYTINAETKAERERIHQEAIQRQIEAERIELQEQWIDRLDILQEDIPDLRESIAELTETFADIDEGYGEYLATTIMASEYGPEVMYYLSQNIGEAQKIVASGPAAATLALGRLEAQFMRKPEPKRNKNVSKAPEPPEKGSRGSGGKFAIRPDTNDLDAFEREFFKKR